MSIKIKLIIYFLIIFIIFSTASGLYFFKNNSDDAVFKAEISGAINQINVSSKQRVIAQLVRYDDEVLTQSARNYAFTGDKKWKDRYFEFVPKLDLRISEALEFGDDKDKEIFRSIAGANLALIKLEEEAIGLADKMKLVSAQKVLSSVEYSDYKAVYKAGIDTYLARRGLNIDGDDPVSTEFLKKAEVRFADMSKVGAIFFSLIVALFFLIIVFLLWVIISIFMKPLLIFKEVARKIINGDLNAIVNIKKHDEIGEFAADFNKMTSDLRESIESVQNKVEEQTREIKSKAQDLADQKTAILNILEDTETQKEKIEILADDLKKFKLALENASDQVVITDVEGVVIYGNRAVETITGYLPEEAIGKKAGALWKMPMPTDFYKKMWNVIKVQKKTFIGEIQNKRKNGEIYTANISISPVLDSEKNVVYFVAIEHDITHEKEVDKAKTEFVSLASHQLRTPLSSINWYTEILLGGDAGDINEDQKKYLNEVYTSSQRMVELVNSLLNVSRLDLGTFVVNPVPVDVPGLIKSLLTELQSQILEKKQIIKEGYDDNLPLLLADQNLLRMVLQNLLSNAVKYTPLGGSVTAEVKMVDNKFTIKISDTGIGIPKNQQDKIFMKLFRADNAKQSETEGTGLGLYIIKSIVDQSGGEVWFESVENKGTTFVVSFPPTGMRKKDGSKSLDM